ncbi:hypothetical protein ZOSMA_137G00370 [Zostera marina]|uniref:Uncharacterized protein n=1 Tax=Zostera marina TaxID=29655 RepID=A0A0K9Q0P3_ZOSMR|nr:hypothetical protein ZOSMA_137G00370 [Zostera marina]
MLDTIHNKLENLGQVLDGHQKSFDDACRITSTDNTSKQQTLEPFLKRCRRTPD